MLNAASSFFLTLLLLMTALPQPAQSQGAPILSMQHRHMRDIVAGCVASNGKYFLTASQDKTLMVWDTDQLKPIRRFPIHSTWIKGIACSPIATQALVVFERGTDDQTPIVILYDLLTGAALRTIRGSNLGAPSFSRDGRFAAMPTYDGPVRRFATDTWTELKALPSEGAVIFGVAFSPDGGLVAAAPWSDGTLRVWDTKSGTIVARVPKLDMAQAVVFLESSTKVLISGIRNSYLIDLKSGTAVHSFPGASFVSTIDDTEFLFTGDVGDDEVVHWRAGGVRPTRLKAKLHTQQGQGKVVLASYLPREKTILTIYNDRTEQQYSIGVHDRTTGQLKRSFASDRASLSQLVRITAAAVSLDGDWLALSRSDNSTSVVNLKDNRSITIPGSDVKAVVGGFATLSPSRERQPLLLRFWDSSGGDIRTVQEIENDDLMSFVTNLSAAKDRLLLYHRHAGGGQIRDLTAGNVLSRFTLKGNMNSATLSPDGRRVLVSSHDALIYSLEDGQERAQTIPATDLQDAQWSPDGRFVALAGERHGVSLWDVEAWRLSKKLFSFDIIPSWQAGLVRVRFSRSGRYVLAVDGELKVRVWDVESGALAYTFEGLIDAASDAAWIEDHAIVLTGRGTTITVLGPNGHTQSSWLIHQADERWAFISDQQRFDTNELNQINGVHWLMPDDPLRPLSPEIFMRDYFEPRLLARLLECRKAEQTRPGACADEFKPVSALSELNRAQPEVEIVSIAPEPGTPDEVAVAVKVSGVEQSFGAAQLRNWQSGVYDLRLFRDGQLVRQAPALDEPEPSETLTPEAERARWRASSRLIEGLGSDTLTFRHIRLPGRNAGDTVDFSAYAFNSDRVKSATARATYTMREALRQDRRAYVIAIGVSAFEAEGWDLQFADDDARRLIEVLEPRLNASGYYQKVVPVPLLADWKREAGPRTITAKTATKANVKAVLDILAGRSVAEEVRRALPNEAQLRRARPDDLVLIAFASHGYADKAGNFYLFPYDIGEASGRMVTPQILRQAISSAELSTWLREVDAGELVMVVDACHSAASVENSEFKPGPMGARGLGQLAYDKGMRILASTRANDVAWESPQTKQGLLSYALVQNGLVEGKADIRPRDGRIGIHEWLQYAVERVPQLYAEAVVGRQAGDMNSPRLVEFDSETRSTRQFESVTRSSRPSIQQPSLFNYKRGEDPILLGQ